MEDPTATGPTLTPRWEALGWGPGKHSGPDSGSFFNWCYFISSFTQPLAVPQHGCQPPPRLWGAGLWAEHPSFTRRARVNPTHSSPSLGWRVPRGLTPQGTLPSQALPGEGCHTGCPTRSIPGNLDPNGDGVEGWVSNSHHSFKCQQPLGTND